MPTDKKKWIVITSGNRPLEDISNDLTQKGFSIQFKMDAIGQISAEGSEDLKSEGLKIPGVTDIVAEHGDINIGNPESDITW